MTDEILDAPDETPSDGAPAEETETPSDETVDEPEADEAKDDEPPKRDTAPWDNFEKKFQHIEDPEERRVAMAQAWWEKNNFASKTLKEKVALERKIAELEKTMKAPKEEAAPDKDLPPPQEIAELDARITEIYHQDQALIKEADQALVGLNTVDTEIAKLEGKLEDAKEATDDARQARLEAAIASQQIKREGVLRDYKTALRERRTLARDYEKLGKERIWLDGALKDRSHRQAQEKREAEEFREEFPEQVDRLIESAARRFDIPAHLVEELSSEVGDGLMVDLWKLGEANLDDVELPELVANRVEKFARMRNIAERRKFADTSKAKLKVTTTGRAPGSAPRAPGKPVSPDSMNRGQGTPKMQKARDYLLSKGF